MEPITLLINRSDITPYAQVALHAREDLTLQPHILAAQNVDVKPVLGAALWYDILTNQYAGLNQELIAGGTYTDLNGNTASFQGVKAALACFAYARYVLSKNVIDTPFGMVSKNSEFSTPVTPEALVPIASEKRNEGSLYLRECITFIQANQASFPLWNTECDKVSASKFIHRITPVTRWQ